MRQQRLPSFIRPIPENYEPSTRRFMRNFEVAFRTESRGELSRMIAEEYGGYLNGRQTIASRMNQVYNQYDIENFTIHPLRINSFNFEVTVHARWRIRWRCQSSNPDRGCPELSDKKSFPLKVRRGRTTFVLRWDGDRWFIQEQRGDILIGLYEPGRLVKAS